MKTKRCMSIAFSNKHKNRNPSYYIRLKMAPLSVFLRHRERMEEIEREMTLVCCIGRKRPI